MTVVNDKASCSILGIYVPRPVESTHALEAADAPESTARLVSLLSFLMTRHILRIYTWNALRIRKTRSYASFGVRRFNASWTDGLSSGIRSSALRHQLNQQIVLPLYPRLAALFPPIHCSCLPAHTAVPTSGIQHCQSTTARGASSTAAAKAAS